MLTIGEIGRAVHLGLSDARVAHRSLSSARLLATIRLSSEPVRQCRQQRSRLTPSTTDFVRSGREQPAFDVSGSERLPRASLSHELLSPHFQIDTMRLVERRRGWLKNGNAPGPPWSAPRCGAKTRHGGAPDSATNPYRVRRRARPAAPNRPAATRNSNDGSGITTPPTPPMRTCLRSSKSTPAPPSNSIEAIC